MLTKYPIVFLSGPDSIFYSGRYWNYIPDWLEAHGYEVLDFNFSKDSYVQRVAELKALINLTEGSRYHYIADPSLKKELEWLAQQDFSAIQSLSMVSSQPITLHNKSINNLVISLAQNPSKTPRIYWKLAAKLHSLWKAPIDTEVVGLSESDQISPIARQYLSWAISLAESDMTC
ncbi:MAG: hypothetical protein H6625_11000 [Bdellovibrionaceae bacterium]|nr:hypothetical protein [Pseudobdellovibrionaceae bacterium]